MFNPKNQNKMKIKLMRSYRSKNGNATFVYGVSANASDLEAFKDAQGDYYREDSDGTPLWFTTRCVGQAGQLIITTNGNVVPDMSAFDQAASLAEQYGGNFGAELARSAAQAILGVSSTPSQEPAKEETPADESADLDDV
jgi:hypothetical protein